MNRTGSRLRRCSEQMAHAGSIHTVYDLLLRYNLHIVGEKSVPINHCLLVNKGVKKEDLTRVLSHPQALAQTDEYLRGMSVVKEAVDDTAGPIPRDLHCILLLS